MSPSTCIFTIIIFILTACKSSQITGRYVYGNGYVFHRLDLKKDSSFVYYLNTDLSIDSTGGQWRIHADSLCLISNKADMPCQVKEEFNTQVDGLFIRLSEIDGMITPSDYICINGHYDVKYFVNELGEIRISSLQYPPHEIHILSIWTQFIYKVTDQNTNSFTITYDYDQPNSFYFEHQIFISRNNKIKILDGFFYLKKVR